MAKKINKSKKKHSSKKSLAFVELVLPVINSRKKLIYRKELLFLLVAELLLAVGIFLLSPWTTNNQQTRGVSDTSAVQIASKSVLSDYHSERIIVGHFMDQQTTSNINVVSAQTVQTQISTIEVDLENLNYAKAHTDLVKLEKNENAWSEQLQAKVTARNNAIAAQKAAAAAAALAAALPPDYLQVPILIYHKTPADFEQQLLTIKEKGYTAIDLGQLVGDLHAKKLPFKSVVITFDDGFADQIDAFNLLEKYQMKATFFIINGGPLSNWCIGANRQYNLPSQPVSGCGDAYLTWDQIRQIDSSGLVTIGSHTIDHISLASLPQDQQWWEIYQGKTELEDELGHSLYDFAYPDGSYTSTTVSLVQQAGFRDAVTTLPGIDQKFGSQYTLNRVRSAYILP